MKHPRLSLFVLLLCLTVGFASTALAAEKSIFLPKGTSVEKTDDGCLKFTLPDGIVVQVKGFMKSRGQAVVTGECGTIGDCGIFNSKGKLIATGKNGKILSGEKPVSGEETQDSSVRMDGQTLWLPAVVRLEEARIFDRLALERLTEEPDK